MSFQLNHNRTNTTVEANDIPGSHPRKNFKDLHRLLNDKYVQQKGDQSQSFYRPISQKPSPAQKQDITLLKQQNQNKQIFYNPSQIPSQNFNLKPFNPNFIPFNQQQSLTDGSFQNNDTSKILQKRRFSLKFNENLKKFFDSENQQENSKNNKFNFAVPQILGRRSKSQSQIPKTLLNQFLTSQQQVAMSQSILQQQPQQLQIQQGKNFIINKQQQMHKNNLNHTTVAGSTKYVNNLQQKQLQQQQNWNLLANNILNNNNFSQAQNNQNNENNESDNFQLQRLRKIQGNMFEKFPQIQNVIQNQRYNTPQKSNKEFNLYVPAGVPTQQQQQINNNDQPKISQVFYYPNNNNNNNFNNKNKFESSSKLEDFQAIYHDQLRQDFFQRKTKPNPLVFNVKDVSSENQIKIRKDLGAMNLRSSLYQLQK